MEDFKGYHSEWNLISPIQIEALKKYGVKLWLDCLTLENLWLAGELEDLIKIKEEELEIVNLQLWNASDPPQAE
jgi:hypothetical protein